MNGKKIIVTGGAGFIGSALTEQLLQTGCKVVCVDNFSTGRRANIAGFLAHPDYTLIEGDICDTDLMKEACSDADYVLHEAALGSVPRSIAHPETSYQAKCRKDQRCLQQDSPEDQRHLKIVDESKGQYRYDRVKRE